MNTVQTTRLGLKALSASLEKAREHLDVGDQRQLALFNFMKVSYGGTVVW